MDGYKKMVATTLKTPPSKDCIEIKSKKVIYFGDPMLTSFVETIEEEMEQNILLPLHNEDIIIKNIKCVEDPPFGEYYDILFFDWGGMSTGNSLLDSFCRQITREAEEKPNTFYIMVSAFTEQAMKDALDIGMFETGYDKKVPINIFLSIKDFAQYWKKYETE